MNNKGATGGFLSMVLSVLGVILWVTIFSNVITPFNSLYTTANATWIAFGTIIQIAPTLLYLAGLFAAGFMYKKGYSSFVASGADTAGLMRMIMGALEIILFVTMFTTVMTALGTLIATNITNFIALTTVIGISPAILFLGGIIAGISTGVGGYRAYRRRRAMA